MDSIKINQIMCIEELFVYVLLIYLTVTKYCHMMGSVLPELVNLSKTCWKVAMGLNSEVKGMKEFFPCKF